MMEAFERECERLKGEKNQIITRKEYHSFNHQHFSYLERGKYINQIKEYEKHFDKRQILILQSERLFEDTQNLFDSVTDFLGLKKHTIPNLTARNQGTYRKKADDGLRKKLEDYLQSYNERLYNYLGIDNTWWDQ